MSWSSTGRAGVFVASDTIHAWTFVEEIEKAVTVAYMRSLQTKDVAALAQPLFDEVLKEAKQDNI